ncbi:MAG TPA: homoserine kinase [Saprospiraceae bacterium]|jgi:homoserine kinase|nr:homoserine kinase [Saprospiraceae bacterium]MBK8887920.1 homoserine kinase [Saprospiraceae bacterium]MBK9581953.1 homoserine kinase [Saprospiraceae bacterium]MBP6539067.1 homoserine kinase [Saprospiraceae bacterium]HQV66224.1 homoserine kinase [Saprospiraceae bacterium]
MSKPGIKVFAPASVANVAVGFDVLGFALEAPGDEIIVREGKQPGLMISEIQGAGGKLPYDIMKNTAGYAAHRLLQFVGETDRPLEMEIHKKMPFGSGLGSSAASAAAGVFAVNEFLKTGLTKYEILRFAVEGEQIADGAFHADNVAPALLGGMIMIRDNETLDIKKLHIPSGLFVSVIYPHIEILTKESRGILKQEVSFKDVIRQQGNLGAFVAAMYTSDFGMIGRSLQDLLVEPQRAHLIPHFYAMKEQAMNAGALGFSISGAGPSMFALSDNSGIAEKINEQANLLYQKNKVPVTTYLSKINHEGAIRF